MDPETYQKIATYHALKLEIKTGMRHSRGSVMNMLKDRYGYTGNTKKKVLAQYEADMVKWGLR